MTLSDVSREIDRASVQWRSREAEMKAEIARLKRDNADMAAWIREQRCEYRNGPHDGPDPEFRYDCGSCLPCRKRREAQVDAAESEVVRLSELVAEMPCERPRDVPSTMYPGHDVEVDCGECPSCLERARRAQRKEAQDG